MYSIVSAINLGARSANTGVLRASAWEGDQCDRGKSIGSVTTGPDLIGVWLGLILTRSSAPREE